MQLAQRVLRESRHFYKQHQDEWQIVPLALYLSCPEQTGSTAGCHLLSPTESVGWRILRESENSIKPWKVPGNQHDVVDCCLLFATAYYRHRIMMVGRIVCVFTSDEKWNIFQFTSLKLETLVKRLFFRRIVQQAEETLRTDLKACSNFFYIVS